MSPVSEKPRPIPDRDSEPFWQAIREGEIRLQRCDGCSTFRWPPRAICNRCFEFDASWQRVSGRGRIVSWVKTHQVFAPAFRDAVPYFVVQVALEDQVDILMIGGWQADHEPVADELVEARFVEAGGEDRLVDWAPVE